MSPYVSLQEFYDYLVEIDKAEGIKILEEEIEKLREVD